MPTVCHSSTLNSRLSTSRLELGTMAHFPKSQVFQMPHCRFLRRARRQFLQRLVRLISLGGCEMSLKARAGCCRSIRRLRTGEVDSPLASDCGDRLARELQFLFLDFGNRKSDIMSLSSPRFGIPPGSISHRLKEADFEHPEHDYRRNSGA